MRLVLTIAIACCVGITALAQATDSEPGIEHIAPADGRSVQVDQGYMVEYDETIPGTEVTFTLMPIPGGEYEFRQGDRALRVKIRPFWIGRTEVTWAEYQEYMRLVHAFEQFDDRGIRPVTDGNALDAVTAPSKLYEPGFTYETGDDLDQPAISMTQYAAKQYTKWLSLSTGRFFRLPSEAEWEYACRADTTGAYHFDEDAATLDDYAWYDDKNDYQTGAVATKLPNAWGLYDTHGNAAEWVLDAAERTSPAPAPGKVLSVEQAIAWPTKVFPRVLKGGSWDSAAEDCAVTSRILSQGDEWKANDPSTPKSPWWYASYDGQLVGFRVVRPLDTPPRTQRERYWRADVASIADDANRRIDKEGRGERGIVDANLPAAIKSLD